MPDWVNQGFAEYANRLPKECALDLVQIRTGSRSKQGDPQRAVREEGKRMLATISRDVRVIALDPRGVQRSTEQLAEQVQAWLSLGQDLTLLIGGPDGLDGACLARADEVWSLSMLTLPHSLVRIVVAEQLYRAWCILQHHPYHRA